MRKLLQSRFVTRYGTVLVLLLLCAFFSFATRNNLHHPLGPDAGRNLARQLVAQHSSNINVLIVVRQGADDVQFAEAVNVELSSRQGNVVYVRSTATPGFTRPYFAGSPRELASTLAEVGEEVDRLDFIVTHKLPSQWGILQSERLSQLGQSYPSLAGVRVAKPTSYRWPTFLTRGNLLIVLNQMAVTAIIAIGMTMVIITAGIDLSVGSLIALSGVIAAWSASRLAGGGDASVFGLLTCGLVAIAICGAIGLFNGAMVTIFGIPSFIVTLAVMQSARGLAYKLAGGPSPLRVEAESFNRLGGGSDLLGIPNPVVLMAVLYLAAYVLMTHTALGRYIYAVGGNAEAARLSGVPVKRVLVFAYVICGALAGLGGIINASLFRVGDPTSGVSYELQIIAAVVVGGTSLAGGEGKIMGTLVGALILAVIRNGMYLMKVDSYTQMVVFGLLILIAVLLDQLKSRSWKPTD